MTAHSPAPLFSEFACQELEYDMKVTLDKFAVDDFRKAFFASIRQPPNEVVDSFSAVGATRDPDSTDYHVHFGWRLSTENFRTKLAYVKGVSKPHPDDHGPFAEDFMSWLCQFFKYGQATANVEAHFRYPKGQRRVLLPLPMKLAIEAGEFSEVEVYGMSIELPSKLHGVQQAYVASLEKTIRIGVRAHRTLSFKSFDLRNDLSELSFVATKFFRENKQ